MASPFQQIVTKLDYPMFIVTTAADDERAGCLVGFATQCSVDPGRFMVYISNKNLTYRVALRARALVVHLVPRDRMDLAELFGGSSGDHVDKFAECNWKEGPDGAPILDACSSWFAGAIIEHVEAGDHTGFLIEPTQGEAGDVEPLGVQAAAEKIEPGHDV